MKKLLLAGTAMAMALSAAPAFAEYSISLFHFNDFHARFESISKYDSTCSAKKEKEDKCFGGIARLKSKLDERRAALAKKGEDNLLLIAGDAFQGTLFYTKYKGKATASFFNAMDIDAFALGNHEFDDGPPVLADFIGRANFPILGGNTNASKEPLLAGKIPGYRVIEKGGQKIGIIGIVTTDTADIAAPGDNVTFENNTAYLKRTIPQLQANGVNKIIVVSHAGYPMDLKLAKTVPGIDVIIGGHSNTLMSNTNPKAVAPYPDVVRGPNNQLVAVAQAYAYSKYLGELKVTFDDFGNVTNASGEPHLLDASVKPDPAFTAKVSGLAGPLNEERNLVVSQSATTIDGDRKNCRARECEMGNLVADALLDRAKDQGITIAIQNGGGLRASIDKGDITMGEVLTVLPFQNTMATFEMKGKDVIAALENGVSRVEDGKGRFPQVAGIRFAWDPSVEALKGRIKKVQVKDGDGWKNIEPDTWYGVVSNNFMRGGGDGYKVFRTGARKAYDYGPGVEEVVVSYLQNHAPYKAYLDGRIVEGNGFDTKKMAKQEPVMVKPDKKPAMDDNMTKPAMAGDHVVVAGDNLWNLAKKHYGDANMWKKIAKANGINKVRALKIGETLKLPK